MNITLDKKLIKRTSKSHILSILSEEKNWKILDIGCGYSANEFATTICDVQDLSEFYKDKNFIKLESKNLPFEDNEFDYIISINTVHNLDLEDCKKAIKEISRVSKKGSFITVDAYRNEDEKKRMYDWNLTAKTIMSVDEWKNLFKEIDYKGDYFWFIP